MKWATAVTAPTQTQAEIWRDMLIESGMRAAVHPGDTSTFLGLSPKPCRVMVAEEDLESAREVLASASDRPATIDPDLPEQ